MMFELILFFILAGLSIYLIYTKLMNPKSNENVRKNEGRGFPRDNQPDLLDD